MYQVATGVLSPADIAAPIRGLLRKQKNTEVILGDVASIDIPAGRLLLSDGDQVGYDTLVLATGASHSYFGKDNWAEVAPGLKTIEDANEIRQRIFLAFEGTAEPGSPS